MDHVARVSVHVDAPPHQVWEALTRPELIEKYLFGTQVQTDWKPGSHITFTGSWKGKRYQDKGKVVECVPDRKLVHTFWSSLEGKPDRPENYKTVAYALEDDGRGTELTLTQDHNGSEEAQRHSEENWRKVLQGVKQVVE
jgi:uncharacterized protein YndB with AHSA1/START domain